MPARTEEIDAADLILLSHGHSDHSGDIVPVSRATVRQVVPMHYGTFPVLTGRPERLKMLVGPHGVDVLVLKPGETAS